MPWLHLAVAALLALAASPSNAHRTDDIFATPIAAPLIYRVLVARDGYPEPRPLPAVLVPPPTVWAEQLDEGSARLVFALAGWPDHLHDQALRVGWCESRLRPGARNPGGAYGLMQVVPLWFRHAGEDPAAWADPVVNARAALAAYNYGGWNPWECQP